MTLTDPLRCPDCGTPISPDSLLCPHCGTLTHRAQLESLSSSATAAQNAGNISESIRLWREALSLLPPASNQYAQVLSIVSSLSDRIDSGPQPTTAPQKRNATAKAGAIGALALSILAKGKLLLTGLANLPTLLSMFVSIGAYWAAFGWQFALGLVLSIYVHEMGHVAALRRFGFKATAPMFIPGLGALIRLRQNPVNPREDARIGLAGPIWGLGAAAATAIVYFATGWQQWGAIAKVAAWINLFNLTPFSSLDGGRGFRALSRIQSWLVTASVAALWFYSRDGVLVLVAIAAIIRSLSKRADDNGDNRTLAEFLFLLLALTLLSRLPVNI